MELAGLTLFKLKLVDTAHEWKYEGYFLCTTATYR